MTIYKKTQFEALSVGQKTYYMTQLMKQAGVKFNCEKAQKIADELNRYIRRIEKKLENYFSVVPVPISELKGAPVRFYRKEKSWNDRILIPSLNMERWLLGYKAIAVEHEGEWWVAKEDGERVVRFSDLRTGMRIDKMIYRTINFNNPVDISNLKTELMNGYQWMPTFWNYREEYRVGIRTVIKTTPRFHDMGEVCPNLMMLSKKSIGVRLLVRLLVVQHRKKMLYDEKKGRGLLQDERILRKGLASCSVVGLTKSRRWKHNIIINVPQKDALYGSKIRQLFHCEDNEDFISYECANGEDYIKANESVDYDGGVFARRITQDGYDSDTENAKAWFPDLDIEEAKEKAKLGNKGLKNQCSIAQLAVLLKCDTNQALQYYRNYNNESGGWGEAIKAYEKQWSVMLNEKYVRSNISGMLLSVRKVQSIPNMQVKHGLQFVMDYALCLMDEWLGGICWVNDSPTYKYKGANVMLRMFFNDTLCWTAEKAVSADVLAMGIESIKEASIVLGLKFPLKGIGGIGRNWDEAGK